MKSPFLRRPFGNEASFNIRVGGTDWIAKRCGVEFAARTQFHVPHAFATSLQQTAGVLEHCALEKADVDMTFESVDVREWCILDTCDGTSIVHHLSDIVTAPAHLRKPLLRNRL